jgi:FkbH-like protein
MEDPQVITLCGRLVDKYGDNGLISVMLGEVRGQACHIALWLMSCRVLKRGMEQAMLDAIVRHCGERGLERIVGRYIPSSKNAMVKKLYGELGFRLLSESPEEGSRWELEIAHYECRNMVIGLNGQI